MAPSRPPRPRMRRGQGKHGWRSRAPAPPAVQLQVRMPDVVHIDGTGSGYAPLGISSVYYVAVDPVKPITIYAVTPSGLQRSVDSGATFDNWLLRISVSITDPSGQTTGPSGNPNPLARIVTLLIPVFPHISA